MALQGNTDVPNDFQAGDMVYISGRHLDEPNDKLYQAKVIEISDSKVYGEVDGIDFFAFYLPIEEIEGKCPIQNPSNNFQAGEFARPSLLSPVALIETATIGSLVRITKASTNGIDVGTFGIITSISLGVADSFDISFSSGWDDYSRSEFEIFQPSTLVFFDLQNQLVEHLKTLLAVSVVESAHLQALDFVAAKLYAAIALDADGFKRELDLTKRAVCACLNLAHGSFLTAFATESISYRSGLVDYAFTQLEQAMAILEPKKVKSDSASADVADSEYMQAQCWICPHCYDDAHHQSDENGCEWQYKQGVDLDNAIDKAMAVSS